jgi:hypothetical protein
MNSSPPVGHRYFVDFRDFQVELDFTSESSLTYYNLDKNGNKVGSETVTIKVEPITEGIFLVTWQESDKTTVVHIEDYRRLTSSQTSPARSKPVLCVTGDFKAGGHGLSSWNRIGFGC